MYTFIVCVHAAVCLLLAVVILMQTGRGGGLTESFSSAESMFGAKTNTFMIKTTAVFATLFLVLSLGLAFISTTKDKSIMPTKVALPQGDIQDLSVEEANESLESSEGSMTENVQETQSGTE